jgi:hypothetical protein
MKGVLLSISIAMMLLLAACVGDISDASGPAVMVEEEADPQEAALPALLARHVNSGMLYPVDPATGEALEGYQPIRMGPAYTLATSPDGNMLASVTEAGEVTLINLADWEPRSFKLELPRPVTQASFSPDGRRLALAAGRGTSSLRLVDLESRAATAQAEVDFLIHQMKFTAEGSGLMAYGTLIENRFTVNEMSPDPPQVVLLDGETLEVLWSQRLEGLQHGIVPTDGEMGRSPKMGRSLKTVL